MRASVQDLQGASFLDLFVLDFTRLDTDLETPNPPQLFFTNTDEVVVGGQVYQAFPVQLEAYSHDPSRAPAQPILHLSSLSPAVRALLQSYQNLIGAELQVSRLFTDAKLPNGGFDPAQVFGTTRWTLDRLVALDQGSARWSLRSDLDREGLRIPRLSMGRDLCPYRVRRWTGQDWDYSGVQCPYTGDQIYDAAGEQVQDPGQEYFSRTLSDCCKRRFSLHDLPFGGFPGLERF